MSKNDFKIGMVCYNYSIEISPTIQNICSFLYDNNYGTVDIFVDKLHRDKKFQSAGANIINFGARLSLQNLLGKFFKSPVKNRKRFESSLKRHINSYSLVLAVDFQALHILHRINFDLSKVVFISLEGVDAFRTYKKDYVSKLIQSCKLSLIQSKEREYDIEKYLGVDIDFEYLPVSLRPVELNKKAENEVLNIIYSGYITDWACLLEFLDSYNNSKSYEVSRLLLQGHSIGTENYLEEVKYKAKGISNVIVDTSYYKNNEHNNLISSQDVGIAFYKDPTETGNFDNLILSSGKIASYLWSGLAIITNIDADITRKPPFIFVENIERFNLKEKLNYIKANREIFLDSAYALANENYNFDKYMGKIVSKLFDNKNEDLIISQK